jgi:hypothetical protein
VASIREWRGHMRSEPVIIGVADPLDAIIQDPKLLAPEKLKTADEFVSALKRTNADTG